MSIPAVSSLFVIGLTAIAVLTAACNPGAGPDSLLSRTSAGGTVLSGCIDQCHSSSNSADLDPLVTNGSGTYGKHVKHVRERGILCDRCHSGYLNADTHINGTIDHRNSAVTVVTFDTVGPAGSWAPGAGHCSGLSCHGTGTMEWYGTDTWTVPACTACHTASYAPFLDPLVTNGSGTAGKHGIHVTSYRYECVQCHWDYPGRNTHADGVLDTPDPSVMLVWFGATSPAGAWVNDNGLGTGGCSSVSCHGMYAGVFTYFFPDDGFTPVEKTVPYTGNGVTAPSWYSTGLDCSACHGNPPPLPNSTLYYVWHSSAHFGGNNCQLCHPDAAGAGGAGTTITDRSLHANGAIDVQPRWVSSCFNCH